MDNRLTFADVKKAVEKLKSLNAPPCTGKVTCDICGEKIYGYYLMIDLPDKEHAIIHAEPHSLHNPCLEKVLDAWKVREIIVSGEQPDG